MPIVILLIRGRRILSEEPAAPFQLGRFGLALNWVGVIFVGVTSVVCLSPFRVPAFITICNADRRSSSSAFRLRCQRLLAL